MKTLHESRQDFWSTVAMTNLHAPRALFYLGKQYTYYVEVWFRKQTDIKNDNSNGEIQK